MITSLFIFPVFSPLEQFSISIIVFHPINVTQFLLYLIIIYFLIFLFLLISRYYSTLVPNYYQFIIESIYKFLTDSVNQQLGLRGMVYFPLFFYLFFFLATSNIIGLAPFSFTITSQIILTFLIAFSFNFGLILLGLYRHSLYFFYLFVPKGAPLFLIPLIVVIELVSYLLRTFSLSIRLAANMMAGHTLLHILTSFVAMFLNSKYFIFSIFPVVLIILAMGLELGIALLQAYVFFILLTLYFNDSLTLGGH